MSNEKQVNKLMCDINRIHVPQLQRQQLNLISEYIKPNLNESLTCLYSDMQKLGFLFPACVQIYNFSYSKNGEGVQTKCLYVESLSDLAIQLRSKLSFHYDIIRRANLSDFETMQLGWKRAVAIDRNGALVNYSFGFQNDYYEPAEANVSEFEIILKALFEHSIAILIVPWIQYENLKHIGRGVMTGRELLEFKRCEQKLNEFVEEETAADINDNWAELKAFWNAEDIET